MRKMSEQLQVSTSHSSLLDLSGLTIKLTGIPAASGEPVKLRVMHACIFTDGDCFVFVGYLGLIVQSRVEYELAKRLLRGSRKTVRI